MDFMERFRRVPRRQSEDCALQTSFNDNVRPLLDAVDKLRQLSVTEQGITLPTIVVVGNQSSGKSSVLESLAHVSLPRGQGIVTRVPLILRLQNSKSPHKVVIQYESKTRCIEEHEISAAITDATIELAGDGKGIVNKPISLHIMKPDAPDLTMVDLPGITIVPVGGQPEDIHDQIKEIIHHYISPKETIILNVICSTVDFSTCESILMSKQVDREGERTMAVVTKMDMSPQETKDKVMTDAVGIGLGYVCVRNRIGDESHEEARKREAELFQSDPHLKELPESMVGIPQLAKRLTEFQAESMRRHMPKLVSDIKHALAEVRQSLDAMPQRVLDSDSALPTALECLQRCRRLVTKLLAADVSDFPSDKQMNFTARLYESFVRLSQRLAALQATDPKILEEFLDEAKGATLPHIPHSPVLKQMVAYNIDRVRQSCSVIVGEVHDYANQVMVPVINRCAEGYPKLQALFKKNVQAILARSKSGCDEFVQRKLDKETSIVFTFNPKYMELVARKQSNLALSRHDGHFVDSKDSKDSSSSSPEMKLIVESYMEVIKDRLCDEIPQELRFSLENALLKDFDLVTMKSLSPRERLLELMAEDPQLQHKRERVQKRLQVLEDSDRTIVTAGLAAL